MSYLSTIRPIEINEQNIDLEQEDFYQIQLRILQNDKNQQLNKKLKFNQTTQSYGIACICDYLVIRVQNIQENGILYYYLGFSNIKVKMISNSQANEQLHLQALIWHINQAQERILITFNTTSEYEKICLNFKKHSIIYGIDINRQYKFKQYLGSGNQAEVSLYKDLITKKLYAIKSYLNINSECKRVMMREINILRQLKTCPGVIKLKRVYQYKSDFHLVFEYAKYGSLQEYALQNSPLNEKDCIKILKQLLEILNFMHQKGIIHRDLKADNILIKDQSKMLICISDFGIAINEKDFINSKIKCGTPGYVDPSVLKGERFSTKSDLFSLACTFYNLLTKEHIFPGNTVEQVLFNNTNLDPQQRLLRQNLNLSRGFLEIMNMMFERDQNKRVTAAQCLKVSKILHLF
ncbi:serine threonine protein kinase [Stylonychia lemnae]|uniref:Serine threonine protein kinase n=1 Tax=Stylonychia lemnae TaxID=5949 RepID=A0A078A1X4_STYLE|nr:serine threonine protein kinase [Stylonychia lemnae]|eukprot:CDW76241.1 serine threonine protein kinase [Stylonychia lemnae]